MEAASEQTFAEALVTEPSACASTPLADAGGHPPLFCGKKQNQKGSVQCGAAQRDYPKQVEVNPSHL
jgi:hypothetical protein